MGHTAIRLTNVDPQTRIRVTEATERTDIGREISIATIEADFASPVDVVWVMETNELHVMQSGRTCLPFSQRRFVLGSEVE